MKLKIAFISLLVATGLIFTGCNKIKSVADIPINVTFPATIGVSLNPTGSVVGQKTASTQFSESVTLDPTTNADVEKYANKIKEWQVKQVTGKFSNVTTPIVLDSMKLEVTSGNLTASWSFKNVTVDNGSTLTLDNADGQWDTINSILSTVNPFTITVTGATSSTVSCDFDVEVTVNTTIIVNPLE